MTDFLRRLPAPQQASEQQSSGLTAADLSCAAFALVGSGGGGSSLPSKPLRQPHAVQQRSSNSVSHHHHTAAAAGASASGIRLPQPEERMLVAGLLSSVAGQRSGGSNAAGALAAAAERVRLLQHQRRLRKGVGPPPYGHRQNFIPRCEEDFGGGGAFPEIHVAQYPLGLGRKKEGGRGQTVALQVGSDGKVAYDAVVVQKGISDKKVVYTRPEASHGLLLAAASAAAAAPTLAPGLASAGGGGGIEVVKRPGGCPMPSAEEEAKELARTKAALEAALERKLGGDKLKKTVRSEPDFYRYTPAQQADGHNSGCAQRVVRVEDMQQDPLNPAKFRHKRVPAAASSPPPPVMHSPTRKVTQQDQAEWKIPPSISNWKNQKGYTIPLDKRLQADGRNLQDVSINDKFASLSEALYIAERQAREEIRLRNEIKKQKKVKEEEMREQQLRLLAAQARAERSNLLQQQQLQRKAAAAAAGGGGGGGGAGVDGGEALGGVAGGGGGIGDFSHDAAVEEERRKREALARERQREVERELRLERNKRGRTDETRDVSERVALGLPPLKKTANNEALFDTRLFNQSAGLDSGFDGGNDESYNLYDQPLFASRGNAAAIYQFSRERLMNAVGHQAGAEVPSFAGADKSTYTRTAPVEFEKDVSDPFGLDNLLSEAKKK